MANHGYPGEGYGSHGDHDERERSRGRDDYRERGRMMFGDDDDRRPRDFDRDRSRGGDEDRGFFERAGEEIRSWFSDDDDDGRSPRSGSDRQRESAWGREPRFGDDDRTPQGWGTRTPEDQRYRSRQGAQRDDDRGEWLGGRDRSNQRGPGRGSGFSSSGGSGSGSGSGARPAFSREREREDSPGYSGLAGTLGGFGNQTFGSGQDGHYKSWRDRQMAELDRDYQEYCRDCEQRFHSDFDSWRQERRGRQGEPGQPGKSNEQGEMRLGNKGDSGLMLPGEEGQGRDASSPPIASPDAGVGQASGDKTGDDGSGARGNRSKS